MKNQSFRFLGVMLVTAFVLGVSLFTGCFNFITSKPMEQPSEEQLVSQVEELACGESIEYLGNGKFSSLERDLEFAEQWTMTYRIMDCQDESEPGCWIQKMFLLEGL